MRRALAIIAILFLAANLTWAGQLDNYMPVDKYFASNQLTAQSFFDNEKVVDDLEESPISGDIYEFAPKSTKRAFFYSLVLPGAGQYYAGSRFKPIYFLSAEALIWTGYFAYHKKGVDKRNEYRAFADANYNWQDFMIWWNQLPDTARELYSHTLPWDEYNNTVVLNHEYYENIGKYDQFQIGWNDVDATAYPPPFGDVADSPLRQTYLSMRKTANDYFQNANTMIMVSLANHIVSAFEAALTAKKFNKGAKRFSFKMKTKDYGNGKVPMVTCSYSF